MAIYVTEAVGGVHGVRLADGVFQPFTRGHGQIEAWSGAWRPDRVFDMFAPTFLLELRTDSGMQGTWYLDASMRRIAGDPRELTDGQRAAMAAQYKHGMLDTWRDVVASPRPAFSSRKAEFGELNPATRLAIAALAPPGDDLAAPTAVTWFQAPETAIEVPRHDGSGTVTVEAAHLRHLLGLDLQRQFANAVIAEGLTWPSPLSGRPLTQVHTLYLDNMCTLFRCVDEEQGLVFYVCCAGHVHALLGVLFPTLSQGYWLKPQQQTLINSLFKNLANRLSGFVEGVMPLLPAYYAHTPRDFSFPLWGAGFHIGHHLWNELSGLDRIVTDLSPAAWPEVAILGQPGDGEAFGTVDELFPELRGHIVRGMTDNAALVEHAMTSGRQIVRMTGYYVSRALRERIYRALPDEPELRAERDRIAELQAAGVPIVVLGLRVENRTVAGIEEFCARVVEHLRDRLGRVVIVIDGHNERTRSERGGSFPSFLDIRAQKQPIAVERWIVAQLRQAFDGPTVTIVDNVGRSVAVGLLWLRACAFFVTPWGAGLAKYRWVANKPGVVVSSRWVLESKNDIHIYDNPEFMEDPAEIAFIAPEHVYDLAEEPVLIQVFDPHHPMYFNFKCNMGEVNALIDGMIARTIPAQSPVQAVA